MRGTRAGIAAALIAIVAALVVAGCGGSDDDSGGGGGEEGDEVTLRLLLYTTAQPAWEKLNAEFEKANPNIKLDVTFLPSDDLANVLTTQIQSGNAPDAFHLGPGRSGVSSIWQLAPEGKLMDLSDQPWVPDVLESAASQVEYDGKTYGWPTVNTPHDPVYNVDLLNELGLQLPKTFDEVLEQCKTIVDKGKVPFVQSMDTIAGGIILSRQFASNFVYNKVPDWDQQRYENQVTFSDSPEWKRMLQAIIDMKDAGCFNKGAEGTSRPQQYAQFANGEAVYSLVTTGELANIDAANPDINYKVFNLPGDGPPEDGLVQSYAGITASGNADTEHPEEVKKWIAFYADAQNSQVVAEAAGGISPADTESGKVPEIFSDLEPLLAEGKTDYPHDATWPGPAVWRDTIAQGINGIFTGQMGVEDTLALADKTWDEAAKALPADAPRGD